LWTTEILLGRQDLHDEIRAGRPPLGDLEAKIMDIFGKSPFVSAHSISERLPIADPTILRHLRDSIGFESFHLH
jgi:hypothetical protein